MKSPNHTITGKHKFFFSPGKCARHILKYFYLVLSISLSAQDNSIVFSNLNVNDGLSDNSIKSIYRDSKGFIWFGTNSGLNRFDGYDFELFRTNTSDSTTITDNSINIISGDKKGNLWIGTRTGISVLDNETFKFRRIYFKSQAPNLCQDINYITAIASDQEDNFLAGTHNGVFLINNSNGSVRHILFDETSCSSPLNNITSIDCDRNGAFWIGTVNGFIIKLKEGSSSFKKFESYKGKSQSPGGAIRLFIDKTNFLWVADLNGLNRFDIAEGSWDEGFNMKHSKMFKNLQVTGIDQDTEGNLWISTDGNGAFLIDTENGLHNITSRPYSEGSLASNGLTSLFCDGSGILWLGNSKKGVDFYKKNIKKFRVFRNYPFDSNSLGNNDVNCITEDYKGNVWIGTNGGGLDRFDRSTGTFSHYTASNSRLSSNIIVSVYEDSDHMIWIGTYLGGLNRLDPASGTFRIFRHDESDSTTISDDRIYSICEDSKKNLWIATLTGGLNLFKPETGNFRRFNTRNSAICFDYLNHIHVDMNDNLWLSSANGLIFFDPLNNRSECFYSNTGSPGSLSDNHIISTFSDSRGLFWVCTNNGLNLMDRSNKTFHVFNESNGLPSNSIMRILEDEDSALWISTKNGISNLVVGRTGLHDSLTFSFTNYGMSDGLQGKEFNETAAYSAKDGVLLFGGIDGLNAFHPGEIEKDTLSSRLVLTGLRIDNIPVAYGDTVNKRILLEKPLFNTEKITLKYKENSFTIDFAALNYFFPEKNLYAYNLEGFNEKWIIKGGDENYSTFSNLDNGNYTFRLKGTNADGIWNETPVILQIRILPPFWKTWYAYLIYIILILSLLFLLRYLTLTSERLRMQIEQEQVEARHIHEIDALKIRFFTNISHEFRTPLSLIVSPAEKLKSSMKDKPEEKQVNLILQNARRLLFMVNELLDFRKMEVQGFGFNPSAGNIVEFIRKSVSSFEDLAEQKRILLVFQPEISELFTIFDRDKLEKIIFNLLSNAFKFTPTDGKVSVVISICDKISDSDSRNKPQLMIRISDTGMGVPGDKAGRLFESFYQADSGISADQGTGLGLSLVKEFVKLHDGEITVESEQGKGTCFTLVIPVKTDKKPSADEIKAGADLAPSQSVLLERLADDMAGEKPTVFIAEDDDDLRFYLKDNLKEQYNIYEAANGNEAYAIIMKIIPDLVISDIIMPGIDGIELCRRIKADKRTCHIPVILLTALAREEKQPEIFETGADDCITKPFNFQLLEARINNLINSRKNLRKAFKNNIPIEPRDIAITSRDDQFIRKALDLVEENISKTDYTVEELSHDLGLSRTLLYKKILTLTGKPPHEFIRLLRLKRAAQLLQKSQLNVSEVAFRVGFNDPKYFRKHFKNEYGMIPSLYSEQFKPKQ